MNTEEMEEENLTMFGRIKRESIVLMKQFRNTEPAFVNNLIDLV